MLASIQIFINTMWVKQHISICQTSPKGCQIGTLLYMVQFQVPGEIPSDPKHVPYLCHFTGSPAESCPALKTSASRFTVTLVSEHIEHSSPSSCLDYAISLHPFRERREGKVVEVGGDRIVQWNEHPELFALILTSCCNLKEISSLAFTFPYLWKGTNSCYFIGLWWESREIKYNKCLA